jgi:hypothetical protein
MGDLAPYMRGRDIGVERLDPNSGGGSQFRSRFMAWFGEQSVGLGPTLDGSRLDAVGALHLPVRVVQRLKAADCGCSATWRLRLA